MSDCRGDWRPRHMYRSITSLTVRDAVPQRRCWRSRRRRKGGNALYGARVHVELGRARPNENAAKAVTSSGIYSAMRKIVLITACLGRHRDAGNWQPRRAARSIVSIQPVPWRAPVIGKVLHSSAPVQLTHPPLRGAMLQDRPYRVY